MSQEMETIAAYKQTIAELKAKLPFWIEEAGVMADMAANSERTGVPADARTGHRVGGLLDDLGQWQQQLRALPHCQDASLTAQKSMLEKILGTIASEAGDRTTAMKTA